MSKHRLTITLSQDILNLVDRAIDGKAIRNRSHAIESILNKHFSSNIHQAVILVGGKKTAISEALTKVAGTELIIQMINLMESQGFTDILILSDQDPTNLQQVLDEYKKTARIIDQPSKLGTAGALLHATPFIKTQPFLVMHGDIFTDVNLHDLVMFHTQQDRLATIGVRPALNQKEFGKVMVHGNKITRFLSTPEKAGVGMINTGVYILDPIILKDLQPRPNLKLETQVFPQLAKSGQLSAFLFEGIWKDVGRH